MKLDMEPLGNVTLWEVMGVFKNGCYFEPEVDLICLYVIVTLIVLWRKNGYRSFTIADTCH